MSLDLPARETLPQLIRRSLAHARPETLMERVDGRWTPISSDQLLTRVENLACAIRAAGLAQGDRVALMAHDCIDWIVSDFAIFFAGCVVVPIYPTQALDQVAYIFKHSGAKLLFIDNSAIVEQLRAESGALPRVVLFAGQGDRSLATFEREGAQIRAAQPNLPSDYEAPLTPDDLAVLIYTSGTTGEPKGVMLSHDNLAFDSQASLDSALEAVKAGDMVLSVLPFSHIFEHTMIYIYLLAGARYAISHDPNELLADIKDTRPVVMTFVPRIFDRVLAGITGNALKEGGVRAKLVPWAVRIGREYMREAVLHAGASLWLRLQFKVAHAMVLGKIRGSLGLDRLRSFLSGSARLHDDVAVTFLAMDITICQGYGLTETSPVITVSRLSDNRIGTVGRAIPGVDVRIAEDGEILTRGRHVMLGYYRDEEATSATIIDGWLHTGDIGELDASGYLRITDRKKELFKTGTGKFVSPARVESALKRSIFIAQAMVVGDGRPFPVALLCPNWDLIRVELGLDASLSVDALTKRPDVNEFLVEQVHRRTSDLAPYEQIRRFIIVPHEFSVESGELSPSMKTKRRVVEQRYASEIEGLYADKHHDAAAR